MIKASEKKYILLLPLMLMLAFACSIKGSAEVGSTAVPDDAAEFESHYYKVYTDVSGFEKASAEKAESFCEKRGGHLAVITSQEEDEFLHKLVLSSGQSDAMFGLKYSNGMSAWVNGEKLGYTNWADDMPDGSKQGSYGQYSVRNADGKWQNGIFGKDVTAYICEWDSGSLISSATQQDAESFVSKKKIKRHGDSYYMVFDILLERGEAARLCHNMGGHLAYIANEKEQKYINELIDQNGSSNMYWIGAVLESGGWEWQSGDDMQRYNNWTSKKPNNTAADADCAVINTSVKTYDKGCWVAEPPVGSKSNEAEYCINYGFVCEWDIVCESDEGEFVAHAEGEWETVSECSCTSSGRRVKYCTRCGKVAEEEIIPAHGHAFAERMLFIPGYTELVCAECSERTRKVDRGLIWLLPFLIVLYFIIMAAYLKARADFERYARSNGKEIKTKRISWKIFAIPPAVYLLFEAIVWIVT